MRTIYTYMIFLEWNMVHLNRENPQNSMFYQKLKQTNKQTEKPKKTPQQC